ncbi:hypothetical protein G5V58_06850 [Nocardioides anomalus]|uniref:Peptidase MA-like domain-containing protein n=1 Tax=Nocardioides anomalus TaxID=2712223 RepID=A0A6G6WBD8_9ACTN|nr:hypothetical protein [Nocardioides anomalus]QIG42529.1 hypothetical protein G5V58_06850 [Nocardioides anomalus]
MTGRRHWVLGGALTALVLAVALVTWLLVRSDPYVAQPRGDRAPAADPAAAAHALRALQSAVEDRDTEAGAALAPTSDPDAADLLTAVVGNADALDVRDFSARYVDAVGGVDGDGRWQAAVDMTWRFEGFDAEPVHEEVLVSFSADGDGGGAGIEAFGGGDRRSPLWLSGPLEVRRSDRTLVLATSAAEADLLSQRAEAAVPVVDRVLPQWSGGLVVEVPPSEEGLDAVLGADPDTYQGIAAVTASVDGTVTPDAQVHVFVNPTVYDGLDPVGGQVVLSHEATHAATGAPLTTGVPMWLLEGFADFVALHDVDLPVSTTAAQIIAQVRQDDVPDQLPGQAEFDATDSHLGAAYESAWLACVVLADAGGDDALVRLYEDVSAGRDPEARMRSLFGFGSTGLTERWQQRLRALADASSDGT